MHNIVLQTGGRNVSTRHLLAIDPVSRGLGLSHEPRSLQRGSIDDWLSLVIEKIQLDHVSLEAGT